MKISYAITVCNEFVEIQGLLNLLVNVKREEDEIVILYDEVNGDPLIEEYLRANSINGEFNWHKAKFENHFADWKNKLNALCSGDWIFQIDADEYPNVHLIENLPFILENNEADIILVPRVNTVQGITPQHVKAWGWKQNEKGWVQWPDHQWRIYKNTPEIKWINKLHEVLEGYKIYANLPEIENYALYHPKTIEKQEKQNNYYNIL
tara:strand:+ start:250 stop:870 length:621 start_codon:yes stop_codon:yes gene_type:complete